MSGLYVHFPWCVVKCPYCDFNSHPVRGSLDQSGYITALLEDLQSQRNCLPGRLDSVFLGGGTPSLFEPSALAPLLQALQPWLTDDTEITMEANPGSREHWDFAAYRRLGINRLSLGAQSFDARQLMRLGRIHGSDEIARAFERARAGGFDNINLDLMYALPEQTVTDAMADLDAAIALAPEHLSWYQLTLEPKTEFARRPPQLPSEDTMGAIEAAGLARLADAGYRRYEVSAFAREGRVCRHNLNYWRFGDYVGIGAGAHGKVTQDGEPTRTHKASQPRLYLQSPAAIETHRIEHDDIVGEIALNSLRLIEGIDTDTLNALFDLPGQDPRVTQRWRRQLDARWQTAAAKGLMRTDRFATTPLGLRYLDTLVAEFLAD